MIYVQIDIYSVKFLKVFLLKYLSLRLIRCIICIYGVNQAIGVGSQAQGVRCKEVQTSSVFPLIFHVMSLLLTLIIFPLKIKATSNACILDNIALPLPFLQLVDGRVVTSKCFADSVVSILIDGFQTALDKITSHQQ